MVLFSLGLKILLVYTEGTMVPFQQAACTRCVVVIKETDGISLNKAACSCILKYVAELGPQETRSCLKDFLL